MLRGFRVRVLSFHDFRVTGSPIAALEHTILTTKNRADLEGHRAEMKSGLKFFLVLLAVALSIGPISRAAESPEETLQKADQFFIQGQFDNARLLYESAISDGANLDRDLVRSRNLARCYLNSSPPQTDQAIPWLNNAIRIDPSSEATRVLLAQTFVRKGDYEQAASQYKNLMSQHPGSAEYVLALVALQNDTGRQEEAVQTLKISIDRAPNPTQLRLEYAKGLIEKKSYAAAREQYQQILAVDSTNLAAQLGFAKMAAYLGAQEQALEMYSRALLSHPAEYEAEIGKAFTLLSMGKIPEARELLKAAAQQRPEDEYVKDTLRALMDSGSSSAKVPIALHLREDNALGAAISKALVPEMASQPAPAKTRDAEKSVSSSSSLLWLRALLMITSLGLAMCGVWKLASRSRTASEQSVSVVPHGFISESMYQQQVSQHEDDSFNRDTLAEMTPAVPESSSTSEAVGEDLFSMDVSKLMNEDSDINGLDALVADVFPTTEDLLARQIAPAPTAAEQERIASSLKKPSQRETNPVRGRLSGVRILVVGGSLDVTEVERRTLGSMGGEVTILRKFAEAAVWLKEHRPELVLVNDLTADDWTMESIYRWIEQHNPDWSSKAVFAIPQLAEGDSNQERPLVFHPFGSKELSEFLFAPASGSKQIQTA